MNDYQAMDYAKYIITKCNDDNTPISNRQLLHILFSIQKFSLKHRGMVAFKDDIEAWKIGPVIPSVYYRFCGVGEMPILDRFDISEFIYDLHDVKKEIDEIIEKNRDITSWQMKSKLQRSDNAWNRIFMNGEGCFRIIPLDYIMEESDEYGIL